MPDEQHEREPEDLEGVLGTVLKSLFGKVDDDAAQPAPDRTAAASEEAEETPEGSVLRVVLDRVNGRLERAVEPEPARSPIATEPEGGPQMNDRDVRDEEAAEPGKPSEGPAPEPAPIVQEPDSSPSPQEPEPAPVAEEPAAAPVAEEPEPAPVAAEPVVVDGPIGERLSHPDAEVRTLALDQLRGRPDDVPLDAVTARLTDPNPIAREHAVEILGEAPEEAVLLQLLGAMQDPAENVRAAARAVFEGRRTDSLVRLLRQELSQPARGRAAAVLLSELGEVDMLIRAMADADPETRSLIREVLETAGVTERLVADLEDPHPDLRLAAADRLGVMRATRAVPDLVRRLEDPDPRVRTNAAQALGAIGEVSAIPSIKQALIADPDPAVVESLVQALRRLASPQA